MTGTNVPRNQNQPTVTYGRVVRMRHTTIDTAITSAAALALCHNRRFAGYGYSTARFAGQIVLNR